MDTDMAWLTRERQREIDSVVEALLARTGSSYPEDELLDIVRKEGVDVRFIDIPKDIGSNVNGIIDWGEKGEGKIYINDKYPPVRKTFTLAHELGHYLLHPGENRLRIDTFDFSKISRESVDETEANYFAASLLMPKEKMRRLLSVTRDIQAIAKYFGVSEDAVKNRVKWLERN